MKIKLLDTLRQILSDRYTMILAIALLLLLASFCTYVGFNVHPSEIQIYTRYSAFGVTHFYHDRWYYLLSFIGFGVIVAIAHILLLGKILIQKGRVFALAFGWVTIALTLIAWIMTAAVFLQVAFRS